jgi:hypothetical protein
MEQRKGFTHEGEHLVASFTNHGTGWNNLQGLGTKS